MFSGVLCAQDLSGEWRFTKGFYESGEEHFGRRALIFEGDSVEWRGYRVIAQSFEEKDLAYSLKGTFHLKDGTLIMDFPTNNGLVNEHLEYGFELNDEHTFHLVNREYQKTYVFNRTK